MIYGISGKAGSDKTTVAKMIHFITNAYNNKETYKIRYKYEMYNYYVAHQVLVQHMYREDNTIIAFADVIKEIVADMVGYDFCDVMKPSFKHLVIDDVVHGESITGRQLFQRVGDALRNEFGEDIFCNLLTIRNTHTLKCASIKGDNVDMFIDDVRYANEVTHLRNTYGLQNTNILMLVNSNIDGNDNHSSEQLVGINPDYTIDHDDVDIRSLFNCVHAYVDTVRNL